MKFWDKIKKQFQEGSILTRLILINLGFFALVIVLYLLSAIAGVDKSWVAQWFAMPADISRLAFRPWTVITYMFLHVNIFHLLFNLIALFWFGKMFVNWLDSNRLLSVYILGGLSGAALYLLTYNFVPNLEIKSQSAAVLGASAAIYAIMVSVAVITPRHKIIIPFMGEIELRYLVLIFIGIDIFGIAFGNNTDLSNNVGGHITHLGGAMFGFTFGYLHKQGRDLTSWFTAIITSLEKIFKGKKKMHVSYKKTGASHETDMEYNARKKSERDEINHILDKISKSGYDSLTKREKEILFKSSKK